MVPAVIEMAPSVLYNNRSRWNVPAGAGSTWIYCTPCEFYSDLLRPPLNSTWIYCTPNEFYSDILHAPANSIWISCTVVNSAWVYCTPLRILLGSTSPPVNSTWIYCTHCEFYLDLLHPPANSTWIYCTALRIPLRHRPTSRSNFVVVLSKNPTNPLPPNHAINDLHKR